MVFLKEFFKIFSNFEKTQKKQRTKRHENFFRGAKSQMKNPANKVFSFCLI